MPTDTGILNGHSVVEKESDAMRTTRWVYTTMAAVLVAGTLVLAHSRSFAQPQAVKRSVAWEYKILEWNVGDPTRSLNDLGQEGWELVTIRGYGNENQALYVLKRPKL
jgi:hypothetical protein